MGTLLGLGCVILKGFTSVVLVFGRGGFIVLLILSFRCSTNSVSSGSRLPDNTGTNTNRDLQNMYMDGNNYDNGQVFNEYFDKLKFVVFLE